MIPPLSAHKGKVIDDRGDPRPIVDVIALHSDPRMGDSQFAAVVERAVRLNSFGFRIGLQFVIVMVITMAALVVLGALGMVTSSIGMGAILGAGSIVASALTALSNERRAAPEMARILLADGLCASCAYGLADIPRAPDGFIVCPECGAAWRNERVISQAHFGKNSRNMPTARILATFWHEGIGSGPERINDDAGVERPLVSPKLRREISAADGERKARLVAAAKRHATGGVFVRWGIAGFLLVVAIAAPYWGTSTLPARYAAYPPIGFLIFAAVFSMGFLRGSAGVTARRIRHEMLKNDLCPSCAADLRTVNPAPNSNNITCPRCTATWNRPLRYDPVPPQ